MRAQIRLVFRWFTIGTLALLALLAAAFWTMILGGFAGSGFRASKPAAQTGEDVVVTPECAWPYAVNDPDARSVCRLFYNLSPEQREQVLRARK